MRKICRGRPLVRQVFSAENVYYSSVTHRPTHFSFSSPLQLLKYLDVFLEKEFDMEALTFYPNWVTKGKSEGHGIEARFLA
eukprot:SAG25_NODE_6708_length_536_cov_0.899314_2_plen_80_part_01